MGPGGPRPPPRQSTVAGLVSTCSCGTRLHDVQNLRSSAVKDVVGSYVRRQNLLPARFRNIHLKWRDRYSVENKKQQRWKVSMLGGRVLMPCMTAVVLPDPCMPTVPGRGTSDVHRPGRHCLHQARSAVSCWESRWKGELALRTTFEADSRIWMTASNEIISFRVWPLPETAMGMLRNSLVGALPYNHYLKR